MIVNKNSFLRGFETDVVRLANIREEKVAWDIYYMINDNITKLDLIYKGDLMRSISIAKNNDGSCSVYTDVVYAPHLEFGTKPGENKPIYSQLLGWVKAKITSGPEAKQITWAVWNSIVLKGTEPKPFFYKALDDYRLYGRIS